VTQPQATAQLDLSPFDQIAPRVCVHKFFCFEFPDPTRQPEAIEHLRQCLFTTVQRWPFIAGQVGPRPDFEQSNKLELRYATPVDISSCDNILVVKHVARDEFPYSYEQLKQAGMPPSVMDMKVLASVPEWPDPTKTFPALSVQANFIAGGLILCFAFHHAVADGGSFITFIKAFGAGFPDVGRSDSGVVTPVVDKTAHKRLTHISAPGDEIRPLNSYPQYNPGTCTAREPSTAPMTTRILQFSAETIRKLEQSVNKYLKSQIDDSVYVTNIGCLSSLIWVAVVRARCARLDPGDTVKIGVAVNVRAVTDPALPDDYFGNAFLHATGTAIVSELLAGDGSANIESIPSTIPVSAVARAAWHLKDAVKLTNKFVMDRLKTFSALEDPAEVFKAYEIAMDNHNTGIDFSSWRDQGANVAFGIPGTTTSTVEFWRKAWSPNEGAYNIFPRKGGSKGEDAWEVSLGLTVEDMEVLCSVDELGAWLFRVLE